MKGITLLAIERFRDVERVSLLLAHKERALLQAKVDPDDMEEYYTETEKIRAEYAEKAIKAGLL